MRNFLGLGEAKKRVRTKCDPLQRKQVTTVPRESLANVAFVFVAVELSFADDMALSTLFLMALNFEIAL